jgi:hypothetical protein
VLGKHRQWPIAKVEHLDVERAVCDRSPQNPGHNLVCFSRWTGAADDDLQLGGTGKINFCHCLKLSVIVIRNAIPKERSFLPVDRRFRLRDDLFHLEQMSRGTRF